MGNSFGTHFRVHTFGESHGPGLGAVLDGCPAGVVYQPDILQNDLARRRPGHHGTISNAVVSPRQEKDQPEILSGIFEGKTLGTPIAVLVRNEDARSQDYSGIATSPRAGHADDVWKMKFGHSDPRGGGRSSGRETLSRVIAGSFAKMFLSQVHPNLEIKGYALQIGPYRLTDSERTQASHQKIDDFTARFPSAGHHEVAAALQDIQRKGESWGGLVEIRVSGMPQGLGQPVFHKLKNDWASALISVGAVSGFEFGMGLESAQQAGTQFHGHDESVYGGIRGGISTGTDLVARVSFKPTSSILNVAKKGRHDPCIVPRAIPVIEAMTALVLADHVLWKRLDQV